MADTTNVKSATAPQTAPVAGNGAATAPVKVERKPREVPTIVCSPDKAEFAEVKAALEALMGGLALNVALGPFVLAAALSHIRTNPKILAAIAANKPAAPAK